MRTRPRCQIAIFDMDGTLTRSGLDFDAIRAAIGITGPSILESLADLSPEARRHADSILTSFEDQDAETCLLQPYAVEVVRAVRAAGIPTVLMTRNSRRSVDILQRRFPLQFDTVRTREDGPFKPRPEPVMAICRSHGVSPANAWVIGDYHYDIRCANAAGATSVLMVEPAASLEDWAAEAHHVVRSLVDFAALIGVTPASSGDVAGAA